MADRDPRARLKRMQRLARELPPEPGITRHLLEPYEEDEAVQQRLAKTRKRRGPITSGDVSFKAERDATAKRVRRKGAAGGGRR